MKGLQRIRLRKTRDVPNSPLPVLLYRAVLAPGISQKARRFRAAFVRNGWTGLWTDTIFDYTHFHSNAHEVLGIAAGRATVELGGPKGRVVHLRAGDMLVLPAGTGHRRLGD
ncbi:MAG TPA: cupin domain-containing protein, partial [Patescibacteria group bacterium]|nr:cupin domain-containing protein [Patescibacteria group bacterium]